MHTVLCRGSSVRMGRWLWLSFGVTALACGGKSSVEEEANGGAAGDVGSGGTGATGGSVSVGGAESGGASGSAAFVPSPLCALPIASGDCEKQIRRFAFERLTRHCEPFWFTGCGANGNSFATLAECEAACGGSAEGDCPETQPATGEMCFVSTTTCHYAQNGCQCTLLASPGYCDPIDPTFGFRRREAAAPGSTPNRPALVPPPPPVICECADGIWSCSL